MVPGCFARMSSYVAVDKLRNMSFVFNDLLAPFLFFCSPALSILLYQALSALLSSLVNLLLS